MLSNSILWGNTANTEDEEDAQLSGPRGEGVRYNCIMGAPPAPDEYGNIGLDPFFADADGPDDIAGTDDDDFRLTSESPCIDAGDPDFAAGPANTDLDGHGRVLCDHVDIGAFEFGIGDIDCNGAVDLLDFASWQSCITGPNTEALGGACEAFDFEADGDVDLKDFAGFEIEFANP